MDSRSFSYLPGALLINVPEIDAQHADLFERLASLTQGLSPAEIAALCNRVGVMAIRQSLAGLEGGAIPPIVTAEMFEQALRGRKAG